MSLSLSLRIQCDCCDCCPGPFIGGGLLLEDGDDSFLLLESGDFLLLE